MENPPTNQVYRRTDGVLFNKIDADLVLLEPESGKYFHINAIGARIWELIDTPQTYPSIITTLLSEYEVTREQCEAEVLPFLQKVHEKGFVTISGE
jgi:hypothetical protein